MTRSLRPYHKHVLFNHNKILQQCLEEENVSSIQFISTPYECQVANVGCLKFFLLAVRSRSRRQDDDEDEFEDALEDQADEDEEGVDEAGSKVEESEAEDEPSQPSAIDTPAPSETPAPTPPPQRTGRRGRPPGSKNKNRDSPHPSRLLKHSTPTSRDPNDDDDSNKDEGISTAPARRGGIGRRGGRWPARGSKRGTSTNVSSLVDSNGNPLLIVDDEIALPKVAKGEAKITENGELLGERQFRVRTFTVMGRGERQYMLSTEPARCMGFRDSYLLFQKHKKLHKVVVSEDEKFDLIERKLIPHSYKGRSIGVVTAKSVFREFGAKIVVGGRRIIDDYDEEESKALGFREGEIADPTDKLPPPGVPYNKNQYVAWHGASAVYHQYTVSNPARGGDASSIGIGYSIGISLGMGNKESYAKRKKIVITDENWMYEHATAASEYNHDTFERRKRSFITLGQTPEEAFSNFDAAGLLVGSSSSTPGGIYEPHTGLFFYPQITQPKRVKYTQLTEKLDNAELNRLGISTNDPDYSSGSTDLVLQKDTFESEEEKPEGNLFVAHPKIIIDTKVEIHQSLGRITGLSKVPSHIFDSVPDDIKKEILKQQELENSVIVN